MRWYNCKLYELFQIPEDYCQMYESERIKKNENAKYNCNQDYLHILGSLDVFNTGNSDGVTDKINEGLSDFALEGLEDWANDG